MTANLSQLPVTTLPHVPRHVFGRECFVRAEDSGRAHDQTERTCVCGITKITLHGVPADLARMWRLPGSEIQYGNELGTPPCTSELRAP